MAGINDWMNNVKDVFNSQQATATQAKTPYQQNVAKPVQQNWYKGNQPTTRETIGQIYLATQQDRENGMALQNQFINLQSDPGSIYYNPYTQATNQAVGNLHNLGINADINMDWYNETQFMDRYLSFSANSNEPSSPGKKSSDMEKIAYQRYQYGKSMEQTNNALRECEALKEEIGFLTNWKDRNYSDDQIVDYLYSNDFAKKYPTLAKMDESLQPGGTVMEFNEAVPYSKDWVYGNIWAARNNGGSGNPYTDMAMSALGTGNQWKENSDISARLDKSNSDTYAPYTVGSTTDDVLMYYGISSYDKNWLNEHRPDGSDKTEADLWNKAWDAATFTDTAREEAERFDKALERKLNTATDPEAVMKTVNNWMESYPALSKLNSSTEKINALVDTSGAINFSMNDVRRKVYERCAENAGLNNGGDTLAKNGMATGSDQSAETIKAGDQKVKNAADIVTDATTAEQNVFNNTPSAWYDRIYQSFMEADTPLKLLKTNESEVTTNYTNSTILDVKDMVANINATRQLDAINADLEKMAPRAEAISSLGVTPQQYWNITTMMNSEDWSEFMNEYVYNDGVLMHPEAAMKNPATAEKLDRAYQYLYQLANADNPQVYGVSDISIIRENGAKLWEAIQNSEGVEPLTPEEFDRYEDLLEAKPGVEAEIERTAGATERNKWSNFMWDARIAAYEATGLDATGLKTGRAVANSLAFFMDYDATEWTNLNRYDAMMKGIEDGETYEAVKAEAIKGGEQIKEELENCLFIKEYLEDNNVEVPDDIKTNIDRHIAKLERDQKDFEYFILQDEPDFDEMVEKGRELEEEQKHKGIRSYAYSHPGTRETDWGIDRAEFSDLINDFEKDRYYYLYGKYGAKEAADYYDYLADATYGVLQTRNREKIQENAQKEVQSGLLGAGWANLKAIISAPLDGVSSLSYTAYTLLSGEEFNPNNAVRASSQYSTAVNAETMKALESIENPLLKTLASGAYEMVYNRGRSFANSVVFGSVTGEIGSQILQEIVGATNMGLDAMGTAIANAKDKGAQDWQAYAVGGVTLLAETLTEGLTYSNISEAIHGTDGEIVRGVKDLMKNWLTKSGVEEMIGESVNDLVENIADEKILGALSEHADLVNDYVEKLNLNPDNPVDMQKAEELARKDELAALAHTAIISYLSPGLDVFTGTISDSVRDFQNIRTLTKSMQKQGMDVSMSDVRKEYGKWKKGAIAEAQNEQATAEAQQTNAQEANQNLEVEDVDVSEIPTLTNNEVSEQEAGVAAPEAKQVSEADYAFLNDLGRLDAVQNSDPTTQAGAIGALFGGDTESAQDVAKAAAAGVADLFGSTRQAVTEMKNLITAAVYQKLDIGQLKNAIQTAALSASSEAYKLVQSEAFQNMSYEVRASMLAATVETDAVNEAVQAEIDKSTYENRVAQAEGELIRNGALDSVNDLSLGVEKAKENLRMANEALAERQDELQAKADAVKAATEAFVQDPSADNQHTLDRVTGEMEKADTVAKEYEQHLENVQRANDDAQKKYDDAYSSAMRDVRQQAEAVVEDQNRQRAEREAQIAEQQRIAQEQAAQAQAEEDQRSGKQAEEETRKLAEDWANQMNLEGEERDAFVQRVVDRQEAQTLGKIDMSGKLSNAEGYLAIMAFGRKTGLKFELSDSLPNGTRGMYQNGTVYLNNNLVKSGSITIGQALVEAALHEIPHSMENTKSYGDYRNAVIGYMYGSGDNFDQAAYDKDINAKIKDYQRVRQNLSAEQAEQEIVADFARLHLADKEVVQRFMDAGLGGKMRNALHNINQALKNFFGNLKGEDRTEAEYLRKAERAYQKALNELAKNGAKQESGTEGQFSVNNMAVNSQMDQDYMNAVNSGDMENAQRIVDEAAKEAGFTDKAYHGTDDFGFTEFDMNASQGEIFVAYHENVGKTYAKEGAEVRAISTGMSPIKNRTNAQLVDAINNHEFDGLKYQNDNILGAKELTMDDISNQIKEYSKSIHDILEGSSWEDADNTLAKSRSFGDLTGESYKKLTMDYLLMSFPEEIIKSLGMKGHEFTDYLESKGSPQAVADEMFRLMEDRPDLFSRKSRSLFGNVWEYLLFGYSKAGDNVGEKMSIIDDLQTKIYDLIRVEGRKEMFKNGLFELEGKYSNYFVNRFELEQAAQKATYDIDTSGLYELYTRPGNQLVIDADSRDWDDIHVEWSDYPLSTRDIAEYAMENGYDSVRINNVFDHGGKGEYDGDGYGDIGIFFNQKDVRSADTVTYDNNGNIIPISKRFSDSTDLRYSYEGDITDADIDQQLMSSGLIPSNQVSVPENLPSEQATGEGNKYRQFGRYRAQESNALHDDVKEYLYNHSAYTPDTNAAQIDRAISWVQSNANEADPDGFFTSMQQAQNGDFDSISADGQARMLTLMSMAALKGEQTGDHSAELILADLFNKQGTEAGRALQARKMFRLMTPVGRMATLNRMADQINEEFGKKGKDTRVHLSQWVLDAAAVAETEDDFDKVRNAAKKELAEQIPANWKEKFTALRMLAMLCNIRTHGRNLLGSLAFMPAVGLKNKIGAALESAFIKGDNERTKTMGLADPEARAFAKQYAKKIEGILRGDNKYNEGNSVQQERKMFGQGEGVISKTLGVATQALIDVNGKFLEAEDWIFLNRHFRNALAGYMTANNLTEADMKGDTLDKATAYAVNEAQKATYRDANEIANWMNNIKNPAAKFVINAVLPFKKTPMNILKRGVEYSPVSIIRSLTTDAKNLKLWNKYQRGELSVLPDKAISPAQYIDRAASGLSGTLILALGALLSGAGFVRSGLDDDEDEFDKLNGSQEYSLEIGGVSYTIDWAAPVCMPFFVGATIMDQVKKAANNKGEDVSIGSVLDALLGIAEPVTQLSMLDGLNTVLNPSNYSDSDSLVQVGEKVITNYFTSYVPTALGQIARSIDTTRRRNFVESGADLKVFRSALEQVENKIPWLSTNNIPYRNVWGEADVSSQGWAIIENVLSPGYGNKLANDPVTNELKRLYQATGNKNMVPKTAGKTVTIDGKSTPLNAEQYDQYVVDRGQTAKACITELMESPVWQICDDNTRAMMVSDAWTYANQIARHNIDSRIKKDSWVANAEYNGNFVETAINRAAETNRKDYISGYGQTMAESLDSGDAEMYELSMAALEQAEAKTTEIRASLRDYFKPLYQQAFETNDKDTMDEIEWKLLDAGVKFKTSDFESWLPSEADEEEELNTKWLNEQNYNR